MDKRDKIKKLEIWLQNGFTDGSIIGETEYNLAYLIVNLLEDNGSERQVDAGVRPFVIIDPYQSEDDLALGIWSDKDNGYLFADGDIYTVADLQKYWEYAEFLSHTELEGRIVRSNDKDEPCDI